VRTRSLAGYQRAILAGACTGDLRQVRATAVIVPTSSAAALLRRTIEDALVSSGAPALVLPDLLTRAGFYEALRLGLPVPVEWLSAYDREVILLAAAHEAITEGLGPPFKLRPALVREMLELYDQLRRQQQGVADFERLLVEELEARAPFDRGAERMLRQTLFLVKAFSSYERRVNASGAVDEHGLRHVRLEDAADPGYRRILVTVADRATDAGGLWPADFDLLARLHGIEAIDVVTTEAQLASGWHERVHALLPGIEEVRFDDGEPPALETRTLVVPDEGDARHFTYRDREEEIAWTVRRIKGRRRTAPLDSRLDRTAVVFARPLPYLYLSRGIFASAGVPFQCDDALPLAAEPIAAAVDLALAFVATTASRAAVVALVRSPHFALGAGNAPASADSARALDQTLARARYAGDPARLVAFAEEWATEGTGTSDTRLAAVRRLAAPALDAALVALDRLLPLFTPAPASRQIRTLRAFLAERAVPLAVTDPLRERHLRARTALLAMLDAMASAHERFGELHWGIDDLAAAVRGWIESQTFTPRTGAVGVHLVDASAARYGRFDDVHLAGLVEGEWPERFRRNLFYSPFLLSRLGWPDDRVRLAAARASFADLLRLASKRVSVSTFLLEDDSLVEGSVLLGDVISADLRPDPLPTDETPIYSHEALRSPPVPAGLLGPTAAGWLALRQARTPAASGRFHGAASPHRPRQHAVGALELYAECPFRYFARHVLRLEEDAENDDGLSPRERGIFVHEVFQRFFERWSRDGHGALTPATMADAHARLATDVEELLVRLPASDAAIERTRLLGSPVAPGLADLVLEMEATRAVGVAGRRLEDRFDGVFELAGAGGARVVPLRGIVDRIDLLDDGTLRVIDYKSSMPTRPVQLAIYAATAAERFGRVRGRDWRVGEAAYVVYGAQRGVKPLARKPSDLPRVLEEAEARAVEAVEGIERGAFPPRPAQLRLCATCAFAGVCRKDHVTEAEEPDAAPAV
jgi:RecB family exonuclease